MLGKEIVSPQFNELQEINQSKLEFRERELVPVRNYKKVTKRAKRFGEDELLLGVRLFIA